MSQILRPGQIIVDTTAGGGGHLSLIAEQAGPTSIIIATDRDLRAFEKDAAGGTSDRFPNIRMFHCAFSELTQVLKKCDIEKADRLLCDLGVSTMQLKEAKESNYQD